MRIRLACYNVTHAIRFSRVNLGLMQSPEYRQIFPDPAARVPAICAAEQWSTLGRARARDAQPSFSALGIRSGYVGLGADLALVDDPYADREEAFSPIVGESVWLWWTDVVLPRLGPDTNVVVMFHRWKEDDLAGRLLAQGGWEHHRYPAIADGQPGDMSGLQPGEPLSPRFSVAFLRRLEAQQGSASFASLFQGLPQPAGGAHFRSEWFRRYSREGDCYVLRGPAGTRERRVPVADCTRVATIDWAGTRKTRSDRTCLLILDITPEKQILVVSRRAERFEGPEAKGLVRSEYAAWRPQYMVSETNGLGLPMTQDLVREGLPIRGVVVHRSLTARAEGASSRYMEGQIYHPESAEWLSEYEAALLQFPGAAHDDDVSAISMGAALIAANTTEFSSFSPSRHVALDGCWYMPGNRDGAPLVAGWAFEPVFAVVVVQKQGEQTAVLAECVGSEGESLDAFAERLDGLFREFLAASGERELDLRHYGDGRYLGLSRSHADYGLVLSRASRPGDGARGWGWRVVPVDGSGTTLEERLALITELLRRGVSGGRPALVIDQACGELVYALAGGCRHKQDSRSGRWLPEMEPNASLAIADALGIALLRHHSVVPKADPEYWEPRRSGGRGAGRRLKEH